MPPDESVPAVHMMSYLRYWISQEIPFQKGSLFKVFTRWPDNDIKYLTTVILFNLSAVISPLLLCHLPRIFTGLREIGEHAKVTHFLVLIIDKFMYFFFYIQWTFYDHICDYFRRYSRQIYGQWSRLSFYSIWILLYTYVASILSTPLW